jgi:hypothetical protein
MSMWQNHTRYPQKLCIRLWKNTLLTWQNQAGMRLSTICLLHGQLSTFAKSRVYGRPRTAHAAAAMPFTDTMSAAGPAP